MLFTQRYRILLGLIAAPVFFAVMLSVLPQAAAGPRPWNWGCFALDPNGLCIELPVDSVTQYAQILECQAMGGEWRNYNISDPTPACFQKPTPIGDSWPG